MKASGGSSVPLLVGSPACWAWTAVRLRRCHCRHNDGPARVAIAVVAESSASSPFFRGVVIFGDRRRGSNLHCYG